MDTSLILDWLLVGLGVILTLGTALFVAAEFSLVAVDNVMVQRRAAAGDKRARGVAKGLSQLSTQLSGAQVGITLTTILLGYTTQNALARLFSRCFTDVNMAYAVSSALAVALALIITNVFSMVFGELVPKNLALSDPLRTAGRVVGFQRGFTTVFKPIVKVLNGSANWILRRFGVEPAEEMSSARSAQELAALVRRSAEKGTLDVSTAAMFTRSVNLSDLSAIDVMTDRGRLHYLDQSATAAAIVDMARETGHSRFPVVGEDLDDILGFVSLRRAVAVPYERRAEVVVTSSSLLSSAQRVPETMELAPLLVMLRDEGVQMAVVVDEYGGTSGIVTLEDVIEEIVGEVSDEHDPRRGGVHRLSSGEWMVPAVLRPDELRMNTGLQVPEDGPYETLGGFVMDRLGRLAKAGDEVCSGSVQIRVEHVEGHRIDRLRVRAVDAGDDGDYSVEESRG